MDKGERVGDEVPEAGKFNSAFSVGGHYPHPPHPRPRPKGGSSPGSFLTLPFPALVPAASHSPPALHLGN